MEWETFIYALLGSIIFMTTVFAVAVKRDRYDIIDIAWGLSFIAIALISYTTYLPPQLFTIQSLVTLLVIIWGLRLSIHIYSRWNKSQSEDKRYTHYRHKYAQSPGGFRFTLFTRIFLLQSLLAAVVSLPVLVVNATQPTPLTVLSFVGLIIWAVGFYFEAVGDYQLKQFISHPSNKGKLMTKGVWNYTRHPNYFGEIAQWWGIFVISLAVSGYWWLAIIGPLVITGLLVFVSGVPLTEKHFASKPGWEEYKRRTSKLLPLPPKQQ